MTHNEDAMNIHADIREDVKWSYDKIMFNNKSSFINCAFARSN